MSKPKKLKKLKSPSKHYKPKCTVPNCSITSEFDGFCTIPKDPIMKQKWCDILKLDPKKVTHRICHSHFDRKDFGFTNSKLTKGALPTLNLPEQNHIQQVKEDKSKSSNYETMPVEDLNTKDFHVNVDKVDEVTEEVQSIFATVRKLSRIKNCSKSTTKLGNNPDKTSKGRINIQDLNIDKVTGEEKDASETVIELSNDKKC